jgi:creatinine amidohydrolase
VELLPDNLPVTILPMIPVGKSNEHSAFPGTLTLSAETLARVWTEIGESVNRAGVRKLVLFNSHGGQPQVMEIVARDLRVRLDMFVVVVNQYSLFPTDLFPENEARYGIHGGSGETSLMLHLRPDLVDMSQAQDFAPLAAELADDFEYLGPTGPIPFAWQAQDLNPAGAVGNALDADATRGAQMIETAATRFVSVLSEVDRYPLSYLREGPLER